jgi:hypothetical protein
MTKKTVAKKPRTKKVAVIGACDGKCTQIKFVVEGIPSVTRPFKGVKECHSQVADELIAELIVAAKKKYEKDWSNTVGCMAGCHCYAEGPGNRLTSEKMDVDLVDIAVGEKCKVSGTVTIELAKFSRSGECMPD